MKELVRLRAEGDANMYMLLQKDNLRQGDRWIAHIHVNGEFTDEQQAEILKKIVDALNA